MTFSNYIKDKYLTFMYNNIDIEDYRDFLNESNKFILDLNIKKKLFLKTENNLHENKYTYVSSEKEKRNYDEEINNINQKTIKGENEDCKENDECISKLCLENKCTRPTDNDKLEYLMDIEWMEN